MINTLSKINLSKIGWEGGGSTSILIMSLDILGFNFSSSESLQEAESMRPKALHSACFCLCIVLF